MRIPTCQNGCYGLSYDLGYPFFARRIQMKSMPCKIALVRFVPPTLTWCISFSCLCSFLVKTTVSLLTQKKSQMSYLWDGVNAMMLVCWFWRTNFLICLKPASDSFLLKSFVPPQMTTKSLWCRWLFPWWAKLVQALQYP